MTSSRPSPVQPSRHSEATTGQDRLTMPDEATEACPGIQDYLEGKGQGKVSNSSVLSILMFPVPGKMHLPRDVWMAMGVRLTHDVIPGDKGRCYCF